MAEIAYVFQSCFLIIFCCGASVKKQAGLPSLFYFLSPTSYGKKNCSFAATNAASNAAKAIFAQCASLPEAFDSMFAPQVQAASRIISRESLLPDFLPTDSQAEVLCFEKIGINGIQGLLCENAQVKIWIKNKLPNIYAAIAVEEYSPFFASGNRSGIVCKTSMGKSVPAARRESLNSADAPVSAARQEKPSKDLEPAQPADAPVNILLKIMKLAFWLALIFIFLIYNRIIKL